MSDFDIEVYQESKNDASNSDKGATKTQGKTQMKAAPRQPAMKLATAQTATQKSN